MSALMLRSLTLSDEVEFRAAHENMSQTDDWTLGLGLDDGMEWADYVGLLEKYRLGVDLPANLVRAAFLVADVDGVIVGRSSIRFSLNEFLLHEGGHIGYGVLAAHRNNGYATEILRQSLTISRCEGVDPALLCCDDNNIASVVVIERCGGRLENVVEGDGGAVRRYWV
ncbi:MAG: GNAT family N-acetyltransferase [Acidimicrobiia bacterium]|nr:GNAT family N-acetyltransferase [Acidimicrobiia bacterium]